ncbi:hypothetical protein Bpfe_016251 [Biomphalaria pfeifferi]|uniref:Uncharacterized protein n=1 Tax=Biomphalaria pfeifferi TaxID=112525 RepID=A0AAD8F8D8_BIOPF|nr:hypothetical protein Bpfe_016251 [Biomphalaria pfeifferi]
MNAVITPDNLNLTLSAQPAFSVSAHLTFSVPRPSHSFSSQAISLFHGFTLLFLGNLTPSVLRPSNSFSSQAISLFQFPGHLTLSVPRPSHSFSSQAISLLQFPGHLTLSRPYSYSFIFRV